LWGAIVHRKRQIVNGANSVCPASLARLRFLEILFGSSRMAALPNLGGKARAGYVFAGVVLASWGFFGAEAGWTRILSAVAGGVLIVEGLIGF